MEDDTLKCPFCSFHDSRVLESRSTREGAAIRRRRECLKCNERFTTYERVETVPLMVVKKDGTREEFNRDKMLRGMMTACEKRPVSMDKLEQVVTEIEREVRNSLEPEVTSKALGEMVMDRLKDIDEVAYVRFASVYRQFADIKRFLDELQTMLEEKE